MEDLRQEREAIGTDRSESYPLLAAQAAEGLVLQRVNPVLEEEAAAVQFSLQVPAKSYFSQGKLMQMVGLAIPVIQPMQVGAVRVVQSS